MTMTEKAEELVAEARRWANGHPNRRSGELMRDLAEALAALTTGQGIDAPSVREAIGEVLADMGAVIDGVPVASDLVALQEITDAAIQAATSPPSRTAKRTGYETVASAGGEHSQKITARAALTTPQEVKWEHGVIGGEDLLHRLMDTLAYYHCRSVNPKADSPHMGYHAMSEDQREFLRERQREAAEEVVRMWAAATQAPAPQEGDARERLHAKCDCVPDLGPAHCHLCGNEKGSPVPWPECVAVLAAAPEPEWEYARQNRYGNVCEPDDSREQAEYRASLGGGYDTVVRRPLVWWEPLPAGGND